jgi:hypothetical protein
LLLNTSTLWKIAKVGEITLLIFKSTNQELIVTIMKNELRSVPSVHLTKQGYLLPGYEYEEVRGL